MIDPDCINVTDLVIKRPRRDGAGGDTDPANDTIIASGLRAYFERTHTVRKGERGEDVVVNGMFLLNPTLADGVTPLPAIRERDYLQHTAPTGGLTALLTVLSVSYVHDGGQVDHIEVDV